MKAKLTISATLAATLAPLCQAIIEGSGRLWDNTRDAFHAAKAEHPAAKDAAAAIGVYIRDTLKANPGSARGYLSQLVWLADNGHDSKWFTSQDATNARYPERAKLAKGDLRGRAAQMLLKADAKEAKEAAKAEADAIASKDPRRLALSRLNAMLAPLSLSALEAVIGLVEEAVTAPAETEETQAANG